MTPTNQLVRWKKMQWGSKRPSTVHSLSLFLYVNLNTMRRERDSSKTAADTKLWLAEHTCKTLVCPQLPTFYAHKLKNCCCTPIQCPVFQQFSCKNTWCWRWIAKSKPHLICHTCLSEHAMLHRFEHGIEAMAQHQITPRGKKVREMCTF